MARRALQCSFTSVFHLQKVRGAAPLVAAAAFPCDRANDGSAAWHCRPA